MINNVFFFIKSLRSKKDLRIIIVLQAEKVYSD